MSDQDCQSLICKESPFGNLRKSLKSLQGHQQCPLNKQQLGFYSWSFLHTFAIYYPETPTQKQKKAAIGLLQGFKQLYPCSHCRPHFQKDYERDPPTVQNRKQFSIWTCRQHNYVNKILGKKQYDQKRWMTGCDTDEL